MCVMSMKKATDFIFINPGWGISEAGDHPSSQILIQFSKLLGLGKPLIIFVSIKTIIKKHPIVQTLLQSFLFYLMSFP